ncbi:uncharacterized protein J3R85_015116 [Psidium guajava]|nr:uncharacterized protein J3R85_015116 [Psidium guajava]
MSSDSEGSVYDVPSVFVESEEESEQSDSEGFVYDVPSVFVPEEEEPVKESTKQWGVVGGGRSASSYEWTTRAGQRDKQTGDYARATTKQTFSSGDTVKERSTGRVGYKETSTVRVGNKGGYSEYEVQERLRTVMYGEGSGRNGKGYNNSLTQKKY